MLRKTSLAETQNALCKQNVCLITEILWKIASSHKIHWNWAIGCWVMVKNADFFIWRSFAILNFKHFHIWSTDCHRVPIPHLCTKFHQNRIIFRWDITILRFAIWRPSAVLNFRSLEFISRYLSLRTAETTALRRQCWRCRTIWCLRQTMVSYLPSVCSISQQPSTLSIMNCCYSGSVAAVAVWVASRPEACRLSQLQGCGFESAPLTSIA